MKKLYRKGTVHPSPPLISDHLSFLPVAILTLAAALSQEDKEVLAYLISCSSGELSGNRRNTHKSTYPNSANSGDSAAVHGGVSGGSGAEKILSGKRKTTHQKSATPNSVSENYGGGSRIASVNGGGGCVDKVLSGDFSGKWRTTHQKSATPNSVSENSGGGSTIAAAHGGANHVASFNCYCFSCYMCYWVKWDSSPNRQLIHEILDAYEDGLHSKKEKSKKERRNNKNGLNLSKNGSSNGGGGSTSCELKKSSSESSLSKNGSCSGFGSCQTDPVEETSGSRGDGGDEEETGGGEGSEKGSVRRFVSYLGEKIWSVWT
ncbi:hypothetical protein K7X08_021760 [Anisodus acutangulus]|uniref:Uncharacterized protein n=1 Tax=Anisodus acutangulus TaxID=402998 RepID=A0A9Q1M4W8_9SOLA|nr:hypothetical protein K7X08_021760 [Anisodus acutangulus]